MTADRDTRLRVGEREIALPDAAALDALYEIRLPMTGGTYDFRALWERGGEAGGRRVPALIDWIGERGYPDGRWTASGAGERGFLIRPPLDFALLGSGLERPDLFARAMATYFSVAFGSIADGEPSFAFHALNGQPDAEAFGFRLYHGRGVFNPEENERPAGRVRLALGAHRVGPRDGASPRWREPMLGGPPGDRPAGLYAHQDAAVFAVNPAPGGEGGAPAWTTLGPRDGLAAPAPFRVLLKPSARRGAIAARIEREPGAAGSGRSHEIELDPDGGAEVLYARGRDEEVPVTIEVATDRRPGRLLDAPPRGPRLALCGVVLPTACAQGRRPAPARGWLHLDGAERPCPVTRPLQAKELSVVVARRRGLLGSGGGLDAWLYRWSDDQAERFARSGEDWRAGGLRVSALSLPEGCEGRLVRPDASGGPFGWVSLAALLDGGSHRRAPLGALLPWLDRAGAVETRAGEAVRLGAWHRDDRVVTLALDEGERALTLECRAEGRPEILHVEPAPASSGGRRRRRDGMAAAAEFVAVGGASTVRSGKRFVLAGHVFEFEAE
ncbi:MAG: hypothetical protein ACFBWO_15265 [Paracoccaceae bacterium]